MQIAINPSFPYLERV